MPHPARAVGELGLVELDHGAQRGGARGRVPWWWVLAWSYDLGRRSVAEPRLSVYDLARVVGELAQLGAL